METTKKNQTLTIILIILVVFCLLAAACLGITYVVLFKYQDQISSLLKTPTALISETPVPAETVTPEMPAEATPTKQTFVVPATRTPALDAVPLPPELASQMDEIQAQVDELRGVNGAEVERELMSSAKLAEVVENDFFKDYTREDAQTDTDILTVLGLINPGFDIYDFYIKVYSEQIAGYYDLDTNVMYVISDQNFAGPERQTYAHEYNHALQNQRFNPRKNMGYDEEQCKDDSEYCAAIQALIEGDSTLTDYFWLDAYGTDLDKQQIEESYGNIYPVYEAAPEFFKADFGFPYNQGTDFVYELYKRGGFEYVDNAFANPPVSTEQILHFKRYPEDKPIEVTLPDINDSTHANLEQIDSGVMGEWYTYLILAKGAQESYRVDDDTAAQAAEGWGGDAYTIYKDKDSGRIGALMKSVWESEKDAQEFYAAMEQYGDMRWSSAQKQTEGSTVTWVNADGTYSTLRIRGDETLWLVGTNFGDPVETDDVFLQGAGNGAN